MDKVRDRKKRNLPSWFLPFTFSTLTEADASEIYDANT